MIYISMYYIHVLGVLTSLVNKLAIEMALVILERNLERFAHFHLIVNKYVKWEGKM